MTSEYNLSELTNVAREILSQSKSKILLFYGEMGAGKTTLIKEICSLLDIEDKISSPTFSLVNEYKSRQGESVYHFDFYRIEDEEEAMDIGFEEYIDSEKWCLIEWPQNIENLLPLKSSAIQIQILENGNRSLTIS
jgi:tRNA threonylcarbamoyladenosine biosynthesis protein TsaE